MCVARLPPVGVRAHPSTACLQNGRTPLMFASARDHFEVLQCLLLAGADKSETDRAGNNALALVRAAASAPCRSSSRRA